MLEVQKMLLTSQQMGVCVGFILPRNVLGGLGCEEATDRSRETIFNQEYIAPLMRYMSFEIELVSADADYYYGCLYSDCADFIMLIQEAVVMHEPLVWQGFYEEEMSKVHPMVGKHPYALMQHQCGVYVHYLLTH